jgi:hypothetical protein
MSLFLTAWVSSMPLETPTHQPQEALHLLKACTSKQTKGLQGTMAGLALVIQTPLSSSHPL